MTKWFRFYADAMRNPKVAKLSDREFRLWVQVLSVASENEGRVPPADELKHMLNARLDHLLTGLERLISGGLIDRLERGYEPHNWSKFQYKSDTSTDRVKKYRSERNVSETPPEAEQIQKQKIEPIAQQPIAAAPRDHLLDRICDAVGVDRRTPPAWAIDLREIRDLIDKGYSEDRDILPVFRTKNHPGVNSIRFFVKIIIDETARRASIPHAPVKASEDWAGRLAVFRQSGTWGAWGPKPGEAGCRVPPELMREVAA